MNSSSGKDVENLTVSFDYLHAPSSGKAPGFCLTRNDLKDYKHLYPLYTVGPQGATPVCENKGEAVINEKPVHCQSCKKDHATYAFLYCPYTPCKICFKTGHDPWVCPFLSKIPKDAEFDRANYKISCDCGYPFNVDKWVCTRCSGHPLLKPRPLPRPRKETQG